MKKNTFVVPLVLVAMLFVLMPAYAQQASSQGRAGQQVQQGTDGYQQGGWYCPWCGGRQGQGMMGQGMNCPGMGQGGMGHGMMGRGGMMHHGGGMAPAQQGKPLAEDQARGLLDNYLRSMNNPNLQLGKITDEKDKDYYTAEILTKDGSLVDRIQVNKNTGWFRSAYAQ